MNGKQEHSIQSESCGGFCCGQCAALVQAANALLLEGRYSAVPDLVAETPISGSCRRRGRARADLALAEGIACRYLGRLRRAEMLYLGALNALPEHPNPGEFLANVLHNLSGVQHERENFRQSALLAELGIACRVHAVGKHGPGVAEDRAALAATLDAGGDSARASRMLFRLLQQALRVHAGAFEVAVLRGNLATSLFRQGKLQAAQTLAGLALRSKLRILGRGHLSVGVAASNYAAICRSRGLRSESRRAYAIAVKAFTAALGAGHRKTRKVLRARDQVVPNETSP